MDIRSTVLTVAAGALVATLGGTAPATAAPPDSLGTPVTSGCPAGQLLSVAELEAQGPYGQPRIADADGDGLVCGQPLPEAVRQQLCGVGCLVPVVYLFRDDDLPAYQP